MKALALLLIRHWLRAALPNRLRRDRGRRASAGLFRLASLVMVSGWGVAVGHLVTTLRTSAERTRGSAWILAGFLGLGVVWSALTRGPSLRGDASPLEAGFLDTLPLRESSRIAVGVLERLIVYAIGIAALVGMSPAAPVRAFVAALALATASVGVGEASMRMARVLFRPMTIARVRNYLLGIGQLVFMLFMIQSSILAESERLGVLVGGWPTATVRAIQSGNGFSFVLGGAACVVGTALGVIAVAERIGYDKIDLVPTGRLARAAPDRLTLERIDDLLRMREPGRWSTVVMTLYTSVVTLGVLALSWIWRTYGLEQGPPAIRGVCFLAAFGSFTVVMAGASRMAARDVTARPLLAPLPIEPRALLAGKGALLRRQALVIALPAVALVATPWPWALRFEAAWRVLVVLVGGALGARAAAAISFLTAGAGSKRGIGGSFFVESILVLTPLIAIVTAPYAWTTLVPLAALALIAHEAEKSALACVRWIDDGDDFERETPIWRALLVLAAFQASQVLTGRLVGFAELDQGTQLALAYAVSSIVLVVLTAQGRGDAPPLRLWPERKIALGVGLLAGTASGALAIGYLGALKRLGVEPPEAAGASRIAIVVMAIALAPLAEEIFFRGWLLPCIEETVRPPLAPLVSAFAFAAVHPPMSFVPVFLLGWITSLLFLRTRALAPGILAHIAHNAFALAAALG